jgi:type IV pilus assembly protein PilE
MDTGMIKKLQGFTLIELMIAVAIIGILTAIALPSYQENVRKSRRADGKAALLGLANAMERHFTEANTYKNSAGSIGTPTDTGTPYIYTADSGAANYYDLNIFAAGDSSYEIRAEPKNGQSSDKCGKLTLTHLGVKNITICLQIYVDFVRGDYVR